MNRQVVVIGGGTTYESYDEYLDDLKNKTVTADKFKGRKDWKDGLVNELGEGFEVFTPRMPNVTNAKYTEWKIWLERLVPFLNDGVILVGHSLGGIFLAKYLSENKFPVKIRSTILIAAPFDNENSEESLGDFMLPHELTILEQQGGQIYLVQSKDDPVVPFGDLGKYQMVLPNAKSIILDNLGHFKIESFPEIVELLNST